MDLPTAQELEEMFRKAKMRPAAGHYRSGGCACLIGIMAENAQTSVESVEHDLNDIFGSQTACSWVIEGWDDGFRGRCRYQSPLRNQFYSRSYALGMAMREAFPSSQH